MGVLGPPKPPKSMQVRIHHGPICQPLYFIHLRWGKYSQQPEIYGRLQSGLVYTALLLIPLWEMSALSHLLWNMKKVLQRYPFEILCGNWSLPYTGWEKAKNQIFPLAPTEISQFQNMASIKTNKIKKRTPLLYINFWKLTTLLFCPKWFIHSKGPKNAICLWLSHNKEHCRLNMQCPLS